MYNIITLQPGRNHSTGMTYGELMRSYAA